jgi:hypothetical protein
MARDTEIWVHPVTSGREAPSDRLATWRFRVFLLLLAVGVAIGAWAVYQALTGSLDTGGGITGALGSRLGGGPL